jgi:hypothetical protein
VANLIRSYSQFSFVADMAMMLRNFSLSLHRLLLFPTQIKRRGAASVAKSLFRA